MDKGATINIPPAVSIQQTCIDNAAEQKRKTVDSIEIDSRTDFALWAIARAQEIVMVEGATFAMAARDMNEEALASSAAALGKAISDAMLEVFDGLIAA